MLLEGARASVIDRQAAVRHLAADTPDDTTNSSVDLAYTELLAGFDDALEHCKQQWRAITTRVADTKAQLSLAGVDAANVNPVAVQRIADARPARIGLAREQVARRLTGQRPRMTTDPGGAANSVVASGLTGDLGASVLVEDSAVPGLVDGDDANVAAFETDTGEESVDRGAADELADQILETVGSDLASDPDGVQAIVSAAAANLDGNEIHRQRLVQEAIAQVMTVSSADYVEMGRESASRTRSESVEHTDDPALIAALPASSSSAVADLIRAAFNAGRRSVLADARPLTQPPVASAEPSLPVEPLTDVPDGEGAAPFQGGNIAAQRAASHGSPRDVDRVIVEGTAAGWVVAKNGLDDAAATYTVVLAPADGADRGLTLTWLVQAQSGSFRFDFDRWSSGFREGNQARLGLTVADVLNEFTALATAAAPVAEQSSSAPAQLPVDAAATRGIALAELADVSEARSATREITVVAGEDSAAAITTEISPRTDVNSGVRGPVQLSAHPTGEPTANDHIARPAAFASGRQDGRGSLDSGADAVSEELTGSNSDAGDRSGPASASSANVPAVQPPVKGAEIVKRALDLGLSVTATDTRGLRTGDIYLVDIAAEQDSASLQARLHWQLTEHGKFVYQRGRSSLTFQDATSKPRVTDVVLALKAVEHQATTVGDASPAPTAEALPSERIPISSAEPDLIAIPGDSDQLPTVAAPGLVMAGDGFRHEGFWRSVIDQPPVIVDDDHPVAQELIEVGTRNHWLMSSHFIGSDHRTAYVLEASGWYGLREARIKMCWERGKRGHWSYIEQRSESSGFGSDFAVLTRVLNDPRPTPVDVGDGRVLDEIVSIVLDELPPPKYRGSSTEYITYRTQSWPGLDDRIVAAMDHLGSDNDDTQRRVTLMQLRYDAFMRLRLGEAIIDRAWVGGDWDLGDLVSAHRTAHDSAAHWAVQHGAEGAVRYTAESRHDLTAKYGKEQVWQVIAAAIGSRPEILTPDQDTHVDVVNNTMSARRSTYHALLQNLYAAVHDGNPDRARRLITSAFYLAPGDATLEQISQGIDAHFPEAETAEFDAAGIPPNVLQVVADAQDCGWTLSQPTATTVSARHVDDAGTRTHMRFGWTDGSGGVVFDEANSAVSEFAARSWRQAPLSLAMARRIIAVSRGEQVPQRSKDAVALTDDQRLLLASMPAAWVARAVADPVSAMDQLFQAPGLGIHIKSNVIARRPLWAEASVDWDSHTIVLVKRGGLPGNVAAVRVTRADVAGFSAGLTPKKRSDLDNTVNAVRISALVANALAIEAIPIPEPSAAAQVPAEAIGQLALGEENAGNTPRREPDVASPPAELDAPAPDRWNIAELEYPVGPISVGAALRMAALATTSVYDKSALVAAANALTIDAWASYGGPGEQARNLAAVNDEDLTQPGYDRAGIDTQIEVFKALASELRDRGWHDIPVYTVGDNDPTLGEYLDTYADAYSSRRAELAPTTARLEPEVAVDHRLTQADADSGIAAVHEIVDAIKATLSDNHLLVQLAATGDAALYRAFATGVGSNIGGDAEQFRDTGELSDAANRGVRRLVALDDPILAEAVTQQIVVSVWADHNPGTVVNWADFARSDGYYESLVSLDSNDSGFSVYTEVAAKRFRHDPTGDNTVTHIYEVDPDRGRVIEDLGRHPSADPWSPIRTYLREVDELDARNDYELLSRRHIAIDDAAEIGARHGWSVDTAHHFADLTVTLNFERAGALQTVATKLVWGVTEDGRSLEFDHASAFFTRPDHSGVTRSAGDALARSVRMGGRYVPLSKVEEAQFLLQRPELVEAPPDAVAAAAAAHARGWQVSWEETDSPKRWVLHLAADTNRGARRFDLTWALDTDNDLWDYQRAESSADHLKRPPSYETVINEITKRVVSAQPDLGLANGHGGNEPVTRLEVAAAITTAVVSGDDAPAPPPALATLPEPVAANISSTTDWVSPLASVQLEGERFPPTPQQQPVYAMGLAGKDIKLQAGAGAGKTSTLEGLARRLAIVDPAARIIYIAFNKTVQVEADERMPSNVEARTGHSLAFRWASKAMQARTRDEEAIRRNDQVAAYLQLGEELPSGEQCPIDPAVQAMVVMRAVDTYANSADDTIGPQHLPADFQALTANYGTQSQALEQHLLAAAALAWSDLNRVDGQLKLTRDHVRKQWALTRPDFSTRDSGVGTPATHVFLDEAQDTPPVLAKVLADCALPKVVVGDQNQAIYGFTGAVDFLRTAVADVELPLTISWRFGPEIADIGNRFLQLLDTDARVQGGGAPSTILPADTMDDPDAIIVRTNAGAIKEILTELAARRTVGVTKETRDELKSLVDTARYLKRGARSKQRRPKELHEALAPYTNWEEVKEAAKKFGDPKLSTLVYLVDNEGIDVLADIAKRVIVLGAEEGEVTFRDHPSGLIAEGETYEARYLLSRAGFELETHPEGGLVAQGQNKGSPRKAWVALGTPDERAAIRQRFLELTTKPDVVVITGHKAKGLEWDAVRIGSDFKAPVPNPDSDEVEWPDPEELRLAYVAVTRAKRRLDPGSLDYVFRYTTSDTETPAALPRSIGTEQQLGTGATVAAAPAAASAPTDAQSHAVTGTGDVLSADQRLLLYTVALSTSGPSLLMSTLYAHSELRPHLLDCDLSVSIPQSVRRVRPDWDGATVHVAEGRLRLHSPVSGSPDAGRVSIGRDELDRFAASLPSHDCCPNQLHDIELLMHKVLGVDNIGGVETDDPAQPSRPPGNGHTHSHTPARPGSGMDSVAAVVMGVAQHSPHHTAAVGAGGGLPVAPTPLVPIGHEL